MSSAPDRAIRRAAALTLAGILVQLVTHLFWSPLMFVVFACVAIPLVGAGVITYVVTVVRFLRDKKAL